MEIPRKMFPPDGRTRQFPKTKPTAIPFPPSNPSKRPSTSSFQMTGKRKHLQLEEWTEKLLEEVMDDLETVDVGVQTDETVAEAVATSAQACQTQTEESWWDFEQQVKSPEYILFQTTNRSHNITFQTELLVAVLIGQAVKQSLLELLEEEEERKVDRLMF